MTEGTVCHSERSEESGTGTKGVPLYLVQSALHAKSPRSVPSLSL
jgi:hypothetical protein